MVKKYLCEKFITVENFVAPFYTVSKTSVKKESAKKIGFTTLAIRFLSILKLSIDQETVFVFEA